MARAVMGVVVDDYVPVMPLAALQRLTYAGEITRQRADMERRRFRFAQRVEGRVEEPGAEVLRFADDRGEGHAVEHVPHLLGDGLQGAVYDLERDRVDGLRGHGGPPSVVAMDV